MKIIRKAARPSSARLFAEPAAAAAPLGVYTAHVDGASRGNPGPAAYAMILYAPDGKVLFELGKYLGRETNNVAEYRGLIAALDYAASHSIARLRIRSDSLLLVQQMKGLYKVKSPDLKPLFDQASKLARGLEYFVIEHVYRESNREADRLANEALDRTGSSSSPTGSGRAAAGGQGDSRRMHSSGGHSSGRAPAIRGRANYVNGVLVPFEPLEIPEGAEVEFEYRITPR
jgi:ribonuclease HI